MLADAERLAAIRERLEAATPGPWQWVLDEKRHWALILSEGGTEHETRLAKCSDDSDAEFIAHAPDDIAYLLSVAAERDALQARIDAVKVWRSWYATGEDPSPSEWRDLDRRLAAHQPEATPEPPHLDPRPLVGGSGTRYPMKMMSLLNDYSRFAPRPADENGRAYSDKREDYP